MESNDKYELDVKVNGVGAMEYMASLIEKNEKEELDVERGRITIGVLKQMNNRSRLLIDAERLKQQREETQQKKGTEE